MAKKYRYKDTDIYIREGKVYQLRLLQSSNNKLYPLSQFFSNEGKILAIINASFFHSGKDGTYVLGRSQGDEYQATYNDKESYKYCDFVVQGKEVKIGRFGSGDYNKSVCGYSPVAILMKDGCDTEIYSEPITDAKPIVNSVNPRTAVAITNDNRVLLIKNEGRASNQRGLTGLELRDFLKENYDIKDLVINDGGGSGEFIEEGKIIGGLSDGKERGMLDGLALIDIDEPIVPEENQKPIFPTRSTWISQRMDSAPSHVGIKAIDFGTWSKESKIRLGLPLDYDYPITAPFDCKVVYVDSQAKGGGTCLESLTKVRYSNGDYDYCSVWIGHSKDTPKLNKYFKQNEVVCHFGDAGAEGQVHLHLEVIKGRFSEIYKNKPIAVVYQKGIGNVYKLESTIEPNKVLYFTPETYVEDNPYDWKMIGDKPEPKPSEELEKLKKENEELKQSICQLTNKIEIKNKALKDIEEIANKNGNV